MHQKDANLYGSREGDDDQQFCQVFGNRARQETSSVPSCSIYKKNNPRVEYNLESFVRIMPRRQVNFNNKTTPPKPPFKVE